MRNKAIEYPHPVLNEYTNDFAACNFSIEIVSHGDSGKNLEFEIQYALDCPGMLQLIRDGIAKMYLRVVCYRTSYRTVEELKIDGNTIITLPKKMVTDVVDFQAMIVAKRAARAALKGQLSRRKEVCHRLFRLYVLRRLRQPDVLHVPPRPLARLHLRYIPQARTQGLHLAPYPCGCT